MLESMCELVLGGAAIFGGDGPRFTPE